MTEALWAKVDAYIEERLVPSDAVLSAVLAANAAAGLPAIDVSAAQGRFLEILVRMTRARRVLEIGTLGGYSTLWMARGLPPDGSIVTLEAEPLHVEVARGNFEAAGQGDRIRIVAGAAAEQLPILAAESPAPFDFIFIDADKPNNPIYLDWALKLSRPGSVIVLDNVIRDGKVIEPNHPDPRVQGTQAAFDLIGSESRLTATALQTVGEKGWDGFAIMIVD